MIDQILNTLGLHPNIEAGLLAKAALEIDLLDPKQISKARAFRRALATAVKDHVIACDHVRDGSTLKSTYRLPSFPAPEASVPPTTTAPTAPERTSARHPSQEDDGDRVLRANVFVQKEVAKGQPMIITVADLERSIDQIKPQTRTKHDANAIRKSLKRHLDPLKAAGKPVSDFTLKIEVVSNLGEMMSDDIKQLLDEVCDDLARLGDIVGRG